MTSTGPRNQDRRVNFARSLLASSAKATKYQSIDSNEQSNVLETEDSFDQTSRNNIFDLSVRSFRNLNASGLTAKFTSFTESDEPLKWSCMFLFLYLVAGVIVFHWFSSFTTIKALYFAIVTSTTLGYGDIHARNDLERLFMIFYILIGFAGLGIFLGVLGDKLVESRTIETDDLMTQSRRNLMSLLTEEESKIEKFQNDISVGFISLNEVKMLFQKMIPFYVITIGGAIFIGYMEGWSIITSIYFWSVTSTSVGYGDITPYRPSMQLFCVFYIPLAIAVTSKSLMGAAELYMNARTREMEKEFMSRPLTTRDLSRMDKDSDGGVDFGEFLSYMLLAMKKVDKKVVDDIQKLFDNLDKDGNGLLNDSDLKRFEELKSSRMSQLNSQSSTEVV